MNDLKIFFDDFTMLGKFTIAPIMLVLCCLCIPLMLFAFLFGFIFVIFCKICELIKLDVIGLKIKRLFFKEPFPEYDKF